MYRASSRRIRMTNGPCSSSAFKREMPLPLKYSSANISHHSRGLHLVSSIHTTRRKTSRRTFCAECGNGVPRGRLFAAARNAALNIRAHVAVVARTSSIVRSTFADPPELLDADTEQELHDAIGRLRIATNALSERQRLALHLRYEQALTVVEVAHVLVISERAAERLLARALDALRMALAR
jgi:RNA polymerase sigma factor (sigma-70 family)